MRACSFGHDKAIEISQCIPQVLLSERKRNNFVTQIQIQDNLYGLSLYDAKVCNSNETSYHNICMFNVIHK